MSLFLLYIGFTGGLGWIAVIMYAYIIAPPDLVATMTAVVNTLMFVICT